MGKLWKKIASGPGIEIFVELPVYLISEWQANKQLGLIELIYQFKYFYKGKAKKWWSGQPAAHKVSEAMYSAFGYQGLVLSVTTIYL